MGCQRNREKGWTGSYGFGTPFEKTHNPVTVICSLGRPGLQRPRAKQACGRVGRGEVGNTVAAQGRGTGVRLGGSRWGSKGGTVDADHQSKETARSKKGKTVSVTKVKVTLARRENVVGKKTSPGVKTTKPKLVGGEPKKAASVQDFPFK